MRVRSEIIQVVRYKKSMEALFKDCKIPEPLDIGYGSIEDPKDISYTLAFDIKSHLQKTDHIKDNTCSHQRIANWVCTNCGYRIANFRNFFDRGGHNLYFAIIDWKELKLSKKDCIYKGYEANNVIELREYMMLLLNTSLKDKIEIIPNMSKKLRDYLLQRNRLWEEVIKNEEEKVLKFNGLFETGNLDQVNIISSEHYVIKVRPDINTYGTSQWFYFSVSNTTALATVKFEIINFTRKMKLYRAGMKIWVMSKKLEKDKGINWHKDGIEIEYKVNGYMRELNDSEDKSFYTLSFKYQFQYDDDEVFFAYTCPYTYSDIYSLIAKTEQKLEQTDQKPLFNSDQRTIDKKGILYARECYAKSVCGIPVHVITITGNSRNEIIPLKKKKIIVITSRVHAGETTGSLMLEGFWNFLFSISSNHL